MEQYNKLQFSSDKPYPNVCVEERNRMYAKAMLDNIGGANSEISAVSLYFYNNLVTGCHEDLSYIFHKISIVEMHHLEIFGKLALELGENPRLWTTKGRRMVYWTPGYNHYPVQLEALLHNSLKGERAAVEKYEQQACSIKDMNIVECLNRIIVDEKIHIQILESLIQEYCNKNSRTDSR